MAKAMIGAVILTALAGSAYAQMPRVPESDIDPAVFKIDEFKYLGVKPDQSLALVDQNGQSFTLKDKIGMPLILVLSYFNCDGTCSVVNSDLAQLLSRQAAWQVGRDFRVLTVSFDPHDSQQSLKDFKERLALPEAWEQGWTLSLPAHIEQAKALADSVGFKYFWSAQDRMFLHPGVYIFLSPEGRVVRYLYSTQTKSFDMGLALTDAMGDRIAPHDILNYAVGLCYSYNYKEGRYKLNIPAFVGAASLFFGVTVFIVSAFVYRRRGKGDHK